MVRGHDDKIDIFKKLIKEDRLSHGYLFFGESHVGKFLFAKSLANFLETGDFKESEGLLVESMMVEPEEGSIGIDAVRGGKQFLMSKPSLSQRRVLIIDRAELLTNQAQNAILKMAEEPPESSLILLVTDGFEAIIPTLRSRLQRIYFPRLSSEEVADLLSKKYKVAKKEAETLAKEVLGKPGLAVKSLNDDVSKEASKLVDKLMKQSNNRKVIEEALEDKDLTSEFILEVISRLFRDPVKNAAVLSKIMDRLTKMSDFTTNKRLQLESALWNI